MEIIQNYYAPVLDPKVKSASTKLLRHKITLKDHDSIYSQ